MEEKLKEEKYEVYKISVIISSLFVISLYLGYSYIFVKYTNFLQTLEEPILLLIGIMFFIYISLGRLINVFGNIFSDIKYNKRYK
jgi:hypothetical protein